MGRTILCAISKRFIVIAFLLWRATNDACNPTDTMAFGSVSRTARVEENCCWVVSLSEFVRALEFGAYAAQCCTLRTARALRPTPMPQAAIDACALLSPRILRVQ